MTHINKSDVFDALKPVLETELEKASYQEIQPTTSSETDSLTSAILPFLSQHLKKDETTDEDRKSAMEEALKFVSDDKSGLQKNSDGDKTENQKWLEDLSPNILVKIIMRLLKDYKPTLDEIALDEKFLKALTRKLPPEVISEIEEKL